MRSLALLLVVIASMSVAVAPPRPRELSPGAAVHRRTVPGTVWVLAAGQGKGTGFVVDARRRLVVTCYHVVGENETCEVVFPWSKDGESVWPRRAYLEHMPDLQRRQIAVQGKVIRRSKDVDLALIEVPSLPTGVEALPLASLNIGPGQRVWAVGHRYDVGTLFTLSAGQVRVVRLFREGYFSSGSHLAKGARLILADVPINEGDSGGPLVNDAGAVVGVSAAVAWEAHGGGLFVDLSELRKFLALEAPSASPASAGATVYVKTRRGTVLVQYQGGGRSAGVVVDRARRLVLTTADAVAREKVVELTFPVEPSAEAAWYRANRDLLRKKGHLTAGVVLVTDARRNLALVEAERLPDTALELALARSPARTGDALHLISHPPRLEVLWAYATGIVRQRDVVILGRPDDGPAPLVLIAQAPLSESEGGGPALDERGELVGLVSGKVGPQQQIAYVLDVAEVRAFLDEVRPRSSPRSVAEYLVRAEVFIAARRYDRARQDFTSALELDAKNADAFAGRAWAAYLQGASADALADADRALTLDVKQVKARRARAAVWLTQGEAKRAIDECDIAIKDDPKCALCYALRSLARLESGDAERALIDADEAVWLDAKLAMAYLARGRVYARQERMEQAIENYGRALAADTQLAEAYRRRADVYWHKSDIDAALADYAQALKHAPADPESLVGRGRARLAKGQHDTGLGDLDDALRLRPKLAEALLARGGEKVRRNWLSRGTEDLLNAVRLQPSLLPVALAELERKAADLPAADEAEAYRLVLVAVRVNEALKQRIAQGLAAAKAEKDDRKRAELLRSLAAVVRAKGSQR